MSNQEVFDMLAELECFFYYRMQNPEGIPYSVLEDMHQKTDGMLCKWHQLTGCKNEG